MTLSWVAVDILRERLRLGHWYPFEIPYHGRTEEQRADLHASVFADLERRGLARNGDVEADLAGTLALLDRSRIALTVIGRLGDGTELRARAVSAGQRAVLAVQDDRAVCTDPITPASMIPAAVGLIPDERPGPGQSITLPIALTRPAEPTLLREATGSSAGHGRQRHLARAILARPRLTVGQFGLTVRDRRGLETRLPELMWFDTDDGRYLTGIRRGPDGYDWATYSPADNARITAHLTTLVSRHT